MDMLAVTNVAGTTFSIGQSVAHTSGWTGTVSKIRTRADGLVLIHVEPDADWAGKVPGSWKLNPFAAKMAGRDDFVEGRDHGLSMGNWEVRS